MKIVRGLGATLGLMALTLWAVPAANAATGSIAEARAQDLSAFETGYLDRERAASPAAKAAQKARLEALRKTAASMTDAQFFLALSEIVALADNGHSVINFGDGQTIVTRRMPLILAYFEGAGLVVLRSQEPYGDVAGASVISIGGHPIEEVLNKFKTYYGGAEARRLILLPNLLTLNGMLQAAGFASSSDSVPMEFRRRDGTNVMKEVEYRAPETPAPATATWPSRWWSPEPIAGDTRTWFTAIPSDKLPLYLQEADKFFRIVPLPAMHSLYVQMRTNERQRGVSSFVKEAERQIGEAKPQNLIMDLRFNKGGDLHTDADFMRRLSSMMPADGHIYVITGQYTFSAGIAAAALIVKSGGNRVTVVGDQVGDRLRFWSEWKAGCTPNTHICTHANTGLFDLAKGCRDQPGCFADNAQYDMVVGSLDPQLKAPMTAEAYFARRDPAMEAIVADMKTRTPS